MTGVYTRLVAWLNSATPSGVTVIVRNPSAPAPAFPYVTVKITSARNMANDYRVVTAAGNQQVTRFMSATVSLEIYPQPGDQVQGENIAQGIMDGLTNMNNMLDKIGRDVMFQTVLLAPQDASFNNGTAWESRVVMDLGFGMTRDIINAVGLIETVVLDGTIGNVAINREVTV